MVQNIILIGCDYLKSKPIKMSLDEAKNQGYAPCKKCDPYGLATQLYGLNQSNNNVFDFITLAELFLIACILYMIIPVFLKIKNLMFDNSKQVIQFIIANSVVISIIYILVSLISTPYICYLFFPFIFGFINYILLKGNIDNTIPTTDISHSKEQVRFMETKDSKNTKDI